MEQIKIFCCLFNTIYKTGNGAAFEINSPNSDLYIIKSFFSSLIINGQGAAGFISLCTNIEMKFSSFNDCYTSTKTDNNYGNAIYDESNGTALIHENIANKCAPIHESGDSSFAIRSASTVEFLNSTNNAGFGGSSGFCATSSETESSILYMNVVNASCKFAVECRTNPLNIRKCNFIDTTHLYDVKESAIVFQSSEYQATFSECIFIDPFPLFSAHQRPCTIINSYADISFSSVPLTNNIQTFSFTISINYKIFHSYSCKQHFERSYLHYSLLFVFLY